MKLKALIAGVLMIATGIVANAEPLYLHIQQADGNWSVIDIEQVDKLTFKNGGMQILDEGDNVVKEIPSDDLKTLVVNNDNTAGIDTPSVADASFRIEGRLLRAAESGRLAIYDIPGRLYVEIPQLSAHQTVDLDVLPSGIYVVVFNDTVTKIELR